MNKQIFIVTLFIVFCFSCDKKNKHLDYAMRVVSEWEGKKPEFIFIFQPKKKNPEELQSLLWQQRFRHPVIIDKEDKINKLNNFPSTKPEHQCFLLDKDNNVVLIGNPSLNRDIWTLYKRVMTERK